ATKTVSTNDAISSIASSLISNTQLQVNALGLGLSLAPLTAAPDRFVGGRCGAGQSPYQRGALRGSDVGGLGVRDFGREHNNATFAPIDAAQFGHGAVYRHDAAAIAHQFRSKLNRSLTRQHMFKMFAKGHPRMKRHQIQHLCLMKPLSRKADQFAQRLVDPFDRASGREAHITHAAMDRHGVKNRFFYLGQAVAHHPLGAVAQDDAKPAAQRKGRKVDPMAVPERRRQVWNNVPTSAGNVAHKDCPLIASALAWVIADTTLLAFRTT
ncbi:hypothetical protein E4T56_gene9124, partial [Termitomyces sp. T112]